MYEAPAAARHLSATLRRVAASFPVVAITGPRQSGKTTLACTLFADRPYVSLENPDELAFARGDPRGFLRRFQGSGAVLDEAQRWPEGFSWLQGVVDQDRRPGRFVLTGSQQFGLTAGISQSLAGRVAVTQLLPFSLAERAVAARMPASIDDALLEGGYPAPALLGVPRGDWFASYVSTYVERDVRQVLNVQDLVTFQRFVRLCAARTGQLLNLSSLAVEAGISEGSARAWLAVLEGSWLVHRLPPYHRNFGKRLVKTPKLYFVDVGLACWLLGIHSAELLALHPMRGALFETWVVGEFLRQRFNAGRASDLFFWRDNNGLEIDLLFEADGRLQPVEIKSGATVTPDTIRAGLKTLRVAADESAMPWVVHGGEAAYERSGVALVPWRQLAQP